MDQTNRAKLNTFILSEKNCSMTGIEKFSKEKHFLNNIESEKEKH